MYGIFILITGSHGFKMLRIIVLNYSYNICKEAELYYDYVLGHLKFHFI